MDIKMMMKRLKTADGEEALEIIEGYQLGAVQNTDFSDWWDRCGSGMAQMPDEDKEEHVRRVCEAFYLRLIGDA